MRKRITKLLIILCIAVLFGLFLTIYVYKPADVGNTAQEATQKTGRIVLKTIHEEKVKDGEIIFFVKNNLDYKKADLAAGYVKKTIWGWKWIYGGEHGSISSMCSINGFSAQFLPAVEGTPFPFYFGAITNPKIEKIKVVELQRNIISDAKISGSGDLRVWYIFTRNLKGSKFDIKAYSKEGKELSFINDDISPYSTDQRPMQQQSAEEYLKNKFGDEVK